MQEVAAAFGAGVAVGVLFTLIKLPLPAPPVLAGVMGVAGVWAGGVVGQWILEAMA